MSIAKPEKKRVKFKGVKRGKVKKFAPIPSRRLEPTNTLGPFAANRRRSESYRPSRAPEPNPFDWQNALWDEQKRLSSLDEIVEYELELIRPGMWEARPRDVTIVEAQTDGPIPPAPGRTRKSSKPTKSTKPPKRRRSDATRRSAASQGLHLGCWTVMKRLCPRRYGPTLSKQSQSGRSKSRRRSSASVRSVKSSNGKSRSRGRSQARKKIHEFNYWHKFGNFEDQCKWKPRVKGSQTSSKKTKSTAGTILSKVSSTSIEVKDGGNKLGRPPKWWQLKRKKNSGRSRSTGSTLTNMPDGLRGEGTWYAPKDQSRRATNRTSRSSTGPERPTRKGILKKSGY